MIKLPFSKIPGFNNLPPALRNNPKLLIFVVVSLILALGFLSFWGTKETQKIKRDLKFMNTQNPKESKEDKDVGVLVGRVDTKSYVARIEKQYYDITAKVDGFDERIKGLEKNSAELRKNQSEVGKILIDLDKRVVETLTQNPGGVKNDFERRQTSAGSDERSMNPFSLPQSIKPAVNLEMAKVAEITNEKTAVSKKSAYLPLGSFVKCTLLTGVYAPSNQNNPLPVLISVDEAFYGPNNARIPLKGAFAIGKAVGDIVSKRAIIQIVSFSMVLPDGKVFEHEANIGYLADKDGQLGIPGELIYNTGRQLGLNFLSGFLAGGAEALSQAETSTVVGAYGQTSRNVTGDTGRYSMFSGLAKSAEGMAGYYQKQLENMVPAVKVEAGSKAVFVIQKGVEIEGLDVSGDSFGYVD